MSTSNDVREELARLTPDNNEIVFFTRDCCCICEDSSSGEASKERNRQKPKERGGDHPAREFN